MPETSAILIQNIFHMLCYAFRILRQRNYQDIATEDFAHVHDMLSAILYRGISQQLKQGLYRSYVSVEEQSETVRGKLDLYKTKQLQAKKIRQADCIHDEFSADNELNRIIKATCLSLLSCAEVSQKQKTELRKVFPYFSTVSDIALNTVRWNRLQYHRNNQSYEMLINICYMIWQSLLPSTANGKTHFSLFDEDSMPRLYEKFILEYYRRHFPSLRASDKAIQWDIPEDTEPNMIRLLPGMHSDITLSCHGLTKIIDAKFYKHSLSSYMDKQMLHSANIYQIYTYVKNEDKTGSGKVSGLLLYARTTEETQPFMSVTMGKNKIEVDSLDLNRSFSEIANTLDSIVFGCFGANISKVD